MKRRDLDFFEGLALLRHFGMPYAFVRKIQNPTPYLQEYFGRESWNGKDLAITLDTTGEEMLHELGHWLVVAKRRRHLPEFGLGTSFRSNTEADRIVSSDYAELEETCVAVLSIVVYHDLGFNWRRLADTFDWDVGQGTTLKGFLCFETAWPAYQVLERRCSLQRLNRALSRYQTRLKELEKEVRNEVRAFLGLR